ncbi:MAG: chromosomal replication initiator protein DnaA, partial [Deltaproteobacteria bacterium]|nr:chromosomal replication initiator protein DnaA [Deltaproteobacteria bacterium]
TAVRSRISGHSFRMWIEPLEFKKGMQDAIILACPNYFSKKRVLDHYGKLIESEIQRAAGKSCGFTVEIAEQNNSARSVKDQDLQLQLPNINIRPHNGRFLKKDFTFDQFVVGGNKYASS